MSEERYVVESYLTIEDEWLFYHPETRFWCKESEEKLTGFVLYDSALDLFSAKIRTGLYDKLRIRLVICVPQPKLLGYYERFNGKETNNV
jgi:hypothetical protein